MGKTHLWRDYEVETFPKKRKQNLTQNLFYFGENIEKNAKKIHTSQNKSRQYKIIKQINTSPTIQERPNLSIDHFN